MGKPAVPQYTIVPLSAEKVEGELRHDGVHIHGDPGLAKGAGVVDYTVTGAQADDFAGGQWPTGTVKFARGELTQTTTILVAGDTLVEGDDTFIVTLSGSRKAVILQATASGTIENDDNAPPTGIPDTFTLLSVDENTGPGLEVVDLDATDAESDPVSYYFKAANGIDHLQTSPDGNFAIDAASGAVTTLRAFNYEVDGSSLSFTAFAGDGNGEDSGTYTVPIRNVSETRVVDFATAPSNQPVADGFSGFNCRWHHCTQFSRQRIRFQ